ncbi:putative amino acid permease 7 [Ananas comosus]|uniref:Putative amino acid permease 7 n=1 Tax=Ananas comosus TaxID=4615 RepID=A0A199UEU3_ANACO|nr:putative amino acid permease 7 [Ananas comosus]
MGDEGEAAEKSPLLGEFLKEADESERKIIRTGTLWTAVAHVITGVIGSGVLSLGWSVAQLGWAGGPIALLFFAGVTLVQSSLLADCYRSPDPECGHIRNRSYMEAIKLNLGRGGLFRLQ